MEKMKVPKSKNGENWNLPKVETSRKIRCYWGYAISTVNIQCYELTSVNKNCK